MNERLAFRLPASPLSCLQIIEIPGEPTTSPILHLPRKDQTQKTEAGAGLVLVEPGALIPQMLLGWWAVSWGCWGPLCPQEGRK